MVVNKRIKTVALRFGSVFVLVFMCLMLFSCSTQQKEDKSVFANKVQPYMGSWQSTIDTGPGKTAPVILHFKRENDGVSATLDSPNQNVFDIPLIAITGDVENMLLVNEQLALTLELKLFQQKLGGELKVRQHKFAVEFTSYDSVNESNTRVKPPQTPEPPFSYEIEELIAYSQTHSIAATLTMPKGEGVFPAVILISGSGPDNRNYAKFGHQRFWVMADHLTKNGIAVLRYDERGVGQSTGNFDSVDFSGLADDVELLITELKKHKKIDTNKIGLIGHSEGTMIGSIVAATNQNVGFLALLGGMFDPNVGLSMQYKNIATELNLDEQTFVDVIKSLERQALASASAEQLKQYYFDNHAEKLPLPEQLLSYTSEHFTSPVMRSFLSYSPEDYLAKLTIPVIGMCGELDQYFDCELHSHKAKVIFAQNPKTNLVTKQYAKLNHYFQTAVTGKIAEEPSLTESISPEVLSDLSQWIHNQE